MTAKTRQISRNFTKEYTSVLPNLLVAGCSFTFNNSETDACSWPYYLRDIAGFDEVFDCSQSGAGNNLIFNSIINELETNKNLNKDNTLVIVAWSGMSRTDVVADIDVAKKWHPMSNYQFDENFGNFSIFNSTDGKEDIDQFCKTYKKIIGIDSQIIESCFRIIALKSYLENKKINHVFATYKELDSDLKIAGSALREATKICFSDLSSIQEHASEFESDGQHPTPNSYLSWSRECLLPYLVSNYSAFFQKL